MFTFSVFIFLHSDFLYFYVCLFIHSFFRVSTVSLFIFVCFLLTFTCACFSSLFSLSLFTFSPLRVCAFPFLLLSSHFYQHCLTFHFFSLVYFLLLSLFAYFPDMTKYIVSVSIFINIFQRVSSVVIYFAFSQTVLHTAPPCACMFY